MRHFTCPARPQAAISSIVALSGSALGLQAGVAPGECDSKTRTCNVVVLGNGTLPTSATSRDWHHLKLTAVRDTGSNMTALQAAGEPPPRPKAQVGGALCEARGGAI